MTQDSPKTRCGFIALIGAPNAGKSTLLNTLIGTKIAIVTHKVQTTRSRMLGIAMVKNAQLIFVDTPGIFLPRKRLERAMVDAAWKGAADAETILHIVDAQKGLCPQAEHIIERLQNHGQKAILILNKIDKMKREALLALSERLFATGVYTQVFMISALTGDGVTDLQTFLANQAEPGPYLYPEDQVADVSLRMIAAEITREKIFLRLHDELPYSIHVETESFKELKDGAYRIEQVIHVARKSQKGMVIGKGGQMLKLIGQLAREDMETAFDSKVHLFLHVRISQSWMDEKGAYENMGLDFVK